MNSRTRTIYLAGPMRGLPDFNYPEFSRVAGLLRDHRHHVYNPAEFPHDGPPGAFPIREAFAEYADFITRWADTIVLLPGWQASVGATAEHALARVCGLDIIEWTEDGKC